jgi:hypothetical protein
VAIEMDAVWTGLLIAVLLRGVMQLEKRGGTVIETRIGGRCVQVMSGTIVI